MFVFYSVTTVPARFLFIPDWFLLHLCSTCVVYSLYFCILLCLSCFYCLYTNYLVSILSLMHPSNIYHVAVPGVYPVSIVPVTWFLLHFCSTSVSILHVWFLLYLSQPVCCVSTAPGSVAASLASCAQSSPLSVGPAPPASVSSAPLSSPHSAPPPSGWRPTDTTKFTQ